MITTTVCDDGRHADCPGEGLVQGTLRPPHEPDEPGTRVWVTVGCECPCHERFPDTFTAEPAADRDRLPADRTIRVTEATRQQGRVWVTFAYTYVGSEYNHDDELLLDEDEARELMGELARALENPDAA